MSSETNEPIGAARNPAPAIAFENVTCSFETPEGVYTATKDVSFSIDRRAAESRRCLTPLPGF